MTLIGPAPCPCWIHRAISAGLVVTLPLTSAALTLLLSSVGSAAVLRELSFLGSYPAVSSEQTARARSPAAACCKYSRRICATRAMEGHSTMAMAPGGVSRSTMRREMRVLPVPQGRMILPRAWPTGRPPLSDWACSRRIRTLSATASSCIHCRVRRGAAPSGSGAAPGSQWGQGSGGAAACRAAMRSA